MHSRYSLIETFNCLITAYFSSRDNINAILGMVQRLKHSDERWPSIPFLVDTCEVVVHLNDILAWSKGNCKHNFTSEGIAKILRYKIAL
jgi:pyridoxal/pyridoxine/pyridoxamine kinase